ncbi:MAG: hypothetical protein AAGA80_17280, partial [Cyanobacteria bacterium P01_F01_bin.143]
SAFNNTPRSWQHATKTFTTPASLVKVTDTNKLDFLIRSHLPSVQDRANFDREMREEFEHYLIALKDSKIQRKSEYLINKFSLVLILDQNRKNKQEPYFYPFAVLQNAKEQGQREIQCQTSFQMVDVLKLIDDVIITDEVVVVGNISEPIKPNNTTKIIKIFLASSSELKEDRKEFEIFINRKNKEYIKQGRFLELILWEDFIDAMSQTRLQDEYNKAVKVCDIFVSLFHTKVGTFTEEEFEQAFKTFKDNKKPLIYTYFKDSAINMSSIDEDDILSLFNFKKKLKKLGHFRNEYKNIDDLILKFSNQLKKLFK